MKKTLLMVGVGVICSVANAQYGFYSSDPTARAIEQFQMNLFKEGEEVNKFLYGDHYKSFNFVNRSDLSISEIYVSMSEGVEWGNNLINGQLNSNWNTEIKIPHKLGDRFRNYDIKINGYQFKGMGFDVSSCNSLILIGANGSYKIIACYLNSTNNLKF